MGAGVVFNYIRLYGCSALKQIILCDMTPKQLNDEEWKLGLYKGRYTRQDMEQEGIWIFIPGIKICCRSYAKTGKIPGFLLKKPLKEILAKCDESVLRRVWRYP